MLLAVKWCTHITDYSRMVLKWSGVTLLSSTEHHPPCSGVVLHYRLQQWGGGGGVTDPTQSAAGRWTHGPVDSD